jgi:hypothetical protein
VHQVGNQPRFVVEILFREKFESAQLEDLKMYELTCYDRI